MNPDDIREFVRKQPFEPFTVHLTDGRSLPVNHPDAIMVTRRMAIILNPVENGSDILHVAFRHISSVDYREVPSSNGEHEA